MPDFGNSQFWIALLHIIAIDVVLSGDNAIVIALACRSLPPHQRKLGIFWGAFGAIALRVLLTFFAVVLLGLAYLKIVGAVLLLWIGINLLRPVAKSDHHIQSNTKLFGAIKTIIMADFVMSLDNVIGVAAAAKGDVFLLGFGLALSIPLIVWGSKFVLALMDRVPITVTLGAGLLGWVGGSMGVSDAAIAEWIAKNFPLAHWVVPAAGAIFVVAGGMILRKKSGAALEETVDLAQSDTDQKR